MIGMNMGKRGQAAIEFLSTYGWAVLVIALVLAALVWLGVFNISGSVPDRCAFPAGTLTCTDLKIGKQVSGGLHVDSITLRNDFDKTVYICSIGCSANDVDAATGWPEVPPYADSNCDIPASVTSDISTATVNYITILPGEQVTVTELYIPAGLVSPLFDCADAAGRTDSLDVGDRYILNPLALSLYLKSAF